MRIGEILRKMADIIDAQDTGGEGTEVVNRPAAGEVGPATDTASIEGQAQVNTASMVSPLQQKLELLKKAAGVDSAFATGELATDSAADEECCNDAPDELSIMKQNAGIPVAVQISAEDNDVEG